MLSRLRVAWRMLHRLFFIVLTVLAYGVAGQASAACKLGRLAELPVTMVGERPVVPAQINGQDALFVADSGAFYSLITHANAEKYGLTLGPAPFGFSVVGATGPADIQIGVARHFTIAGVPLNRVEFLVGGSEMGAQTAGVLGQNIFQAGDVEYDLASGAIRLFRPDGCGHALLAYWVKPDQPFAVISIQWTTPMQPHTRGEVSVNGVSLMATFDTGAASSVLSLRGARRAGVRTDSPGVAANGRSAGIGQRTVQSWVAPIASFKIGDEEIKNTRMQIADIELPDSDMLVGADFFLSHRVYVATGQHKLYLTYNGGSVFNLTSPPPGASPPVGPAIAAAVGVDVSAPGDPIDAAGFSRRGEAFLSRHQMDKALADLSRAIALAPDNADYAYQRAQAQMASQQPQLARADLDRALLLKPDHLGALVLRAELALHGPDHDRAIMDLDVADRLASKQDDVRLQLAHAYLAADRLPAAIGQFDLWISEHGVDYRLAQARNGRCWARGLLGQDLDKALADCNGALRLAPHTAPILDSRGLVYLRRGELDKAIADYDAALKLRSDSAWSHYGRGLAKLGKGLKVEGEADLAAGIAIDSRLPSDAKRYGLTSPNEQTAAAPD